MVWKKIFNIPLNIEIFLQEQRSAIQNVIRYLHSLGAFSEMFVSKYAIEYKKDNGLEIAAVN